jgi:hypothetical protein
VSLSLADYFGPYINHSDATPAMYGRAIQLLRYVNPFLDEAVTEGIWKWPVNPATKSSISGEGNGGFRSFACTVGAVHSQHKNAQAVDIYDPDNAIDTWITSFSSSDGVFNSLLERFGLYREAPLSTIHWAHLQCVQPLSGHRTFYP